MNNRQRTLNLHNFKTYILEGLMMVYSVKKSNNGMYVITTKEFGKIDIYPKANKLMFHSNCKWISGGSEWLCNNL